jgi:hypothetical protein
MRCRWMAGPGTWVLLPAVALAASCGHDGPGAGDGSDGDAADAVDRPDTPDTADSEAALPFVVVLEAESGEDLGAMTEMRGVLADPACGNAWVAVPAGEPDFVWDPAAPVLPAHRTELAFDAPHAGTYYLWLRLAAPAEEQDALYVGLDAADLRRVFPPDAYPYDGSWVWISEVPGAPGRLVFDGVAAGPHTLVLAHGEAGTRGDKVVIADSPTATFDRTCGGAPACTDGTTESRACAVAHGTGVETRTCAGGVWGAFGACSVTGCDAGYHRDVERCVEDTTPTGDYPFQGYTTTRGGFESPVDGGLAPRILVVDRLGADDSDGDETTGRGSLPWALARSYPRVVLFEVSGVIDVGGSLDVRSPYVSVHGQTAPSPGITLYDVSMLVVTHDVILQHLRVRMGDTELGGGDPLGVCGSAEGEVGDIVIDHCSAELGHDEQLSISSCGVGDVRRVTLSNNLIGFGLNYAGHAYGTLIDSGDSNDFDVDEILVEGNLYSNVSFRTPMVNDAARRVTIANNVTYNPLVCGMHFNTAQYPEGQLIDVLHNLSWRGPETHVAGTWPTDEVATWPAEPDVWPWEPRRRWVGCFYGPSGTNTHVYYDANYDYVNNEDYAYGDHAGRPIHMEFESFDGGIGVSDVEETVRQTSVAVALRTPVEVEEHVRSDVGCTPGDRDAVDALLVQDAFDRTGGYIDHVGDLGLAPFPAGGGTRSLGDIGGYPAGRELDDADGDGLTDLEEWLYGL